MMRSTLLACAMGVLATVPVSYFLAVPARQDRTATFASGDSTASEVVVAVEAWTICSTMSVMAETPDWATLDPDFAAGKRAVLAGDWNEAIRALTSAGLRDARNADIQNYLGYAHRRLWKLDPAIRRYEQALALNPRHRSAHGHLGEAHLIQGDLAKAQEQLKALEKICLIPCDEYDDLKFAIAKYNRVTRD